MDTLNKTHAAQEKRLWYLDFLRIFAAIAIVFLHVTPLNQPDVSVASAVWKTLNVISSFFRWGVPVFFMISGALFLSEKRAFSTKRLYQKTLARIMTSFVFWSGVYALAYCLTTGKGKWTFINQFLRGHYHMWYLFSIIGLYIVTPLLRRVTESKKATEYFLISGFILAFLIPRVLAFLQLFPLPHADVLASFQSAYTQTNPYGGLHALYYYVLGHYLSAYPVGKNARRLIYGAGIAGLAATIVLTDWHSNRLGTTSAQFYELSTLNILAVACALFLAFKSGFATVSPQGRFKDAILHLSKCSFGVYLVHPLIIERLNLTFPLSPLLLSLGVPLAALSIALFSLILSSILNRIPLLNRYIV